MSQKDTNYKNKMSRQGIVQKNIRVPEWCAYDFELMAKFCRDNPDYYPAHCRNRKTGRISKSIN